MKQEKLIAITAGILVAVLIAGVILVTNEELRDQIFNNIFEETKTIETGDCVDVHYIGWFSNNTIFDTSYNDTDSKTGGTPLKMFASNDIISCPDDCFPVISGLAEELVGLKEGETKTIGPIPPEEAYGNGPKVGDQISYTLAEEDFTITLTINNIEEDQPMPEEYIYIFGDKLTTVYTLKEESYKVGHTETFYSAWPDATEITIVNDTTAVFYTTPPDDKMVNFTWYNDTLVIYYWEDASSVTSIDEEQIVVTHSPDIGDTLSHTSSYSTIVFTVVNITDGKINTSYVDSTGSISYYEFNRVDKIKRSQEYNLIKEMPQEGLEQFVSLLQQYFETELTFSLNPLAGKSLTFEVEIVKIYKNN